MLQDVITKTLESCLLTDTELALGVEAWAEWPCPWDMLDL